MKNLIAITAILYLFVIQTPTYAQSTANMISKKNIFCDLYNYNYFSLDERNTNSCKTPSTDWCISSVEPISYDANNSSDYYEGKMRFYAKETDSNGIPNGTNTYLGVTSVRGDLARPGFRGYPHGGETRYIWSFATLGLAELFFQIGDAVDNINYDNTKTDASEFNKLLIKKVQAATEEYKLITLKEKACPTLRASTKIDNLWDEYSTFVKNNAKKASKNIKAPSRRSNSIFLEDYFSATQ